MAFLPITNEEMKQRGWDQADFVLVTGDAYVDHPSFGAAIISRVLEDEGFRVAVLPQPDWKTNRDFTRFGKPRLDVYKRQITSLAETQGCSLPVKLIFTIFGMLI